MNSQGEGNQPQSDTDEKPNPPIPPQTAVSESNIPANPAQQPDQQQSTAKERAREFRLVEILAVALNAVLVIVGGIALWIYRGQLDVMQKTLNEMQSSGATATTQANRVINNLNWLGYTMQGSLNATVSQYQKDQRAWLGIEKSYLVKSINPTKITVEMNFRNTGHTPALDVISWTNTTVSPVRVAGPSVDWAAKRNYVRSGAIAPQSPLIRDVTVATPEQAVNIESLRNGTQFVYVYGEFEYWDVTRTIKGLTQFCIGVGMSEVENPDTFNCSEFHNMR